MSDEDASGGWGRMHEDEEDAFGRHDDRNPDSNAGTLRIGTPMPLPNAFASNLPPSGEADASQTDGDMWAIFWLAISWSQRCWRFLPMFAHKKIKWSIP